MHYRMKKKMDEIKENIIKFIEDKVINHCFKHDVQGVPYCLRIEHFVVPTPYGDSEGNEMIDTTFMSKDYFEDDDKEFHNHCRELEMNLICPIGTLNASSLDDFKSRFYKKWQEITEEEFLIRRDKAKERRVEGV